MVIQRPILVWYGSSTVDSDYCGNYFGSAGTAAEKNPLYNYHCTAVCVWVGPGSFNALEKKINSRDVQEKFRAAHTFKGVCANLGFSQLFNYSSELTELFRAVHPVGQRLTEILPV